MRAIVQTIIADRPAIYATPDLADINGNGGDRINKKISQVLKKMLEANGVAAGGAMVSEEVARLSRSKKGENTAASPKKTPTKGKTRKVKVKYDEDELGDEALKEKSA